MPGGGAYHITGGGICLKGRNMRGSRVSSSSVRGFRVLGARVLSFRVLARVSSSRTLGCKWLRGPPRPARRCDISVTRAGASATRA
eukprot:6589230-Pyramimonas_sp.AAC.2